MQQQPTTTFTLRMDTRLLESARIMANVLGIPLGEYISSATEARLSGDIEVNIQAYEAVRAAREKARTSGELKG